VIDLLYWPTPNGWKISIALEELGLPYTVKPVNIGRGEQFEPAFVAVSPNGRIPAIVDHGAAGGEPLALFESGAILFYLAEKTGRLLAHEGPARHQAMAWLMWQMSGLGPMLGQHGHFSLYAEDKIAYAIDRYRREARRLYDVLDAQLARSEHAAGDVYSIADIAIFPWVVTHKAQGFTLDDWPQVKRWFAAVRARDAVQRGMAVGKEWRRSGAPDAEARRNLFGSAGNPVERTT